MKAALPVIILILISVSVYGQNENPYSIFGYEAPIMSDKTQTVDKLLLINRDSTSSVWILAVDPSERTITIFDKNKVVLQCDTLANYTMMRWLSPDPYGQFNSPYLGMGNKPHMGVDPDGGLTRPELIWMGLTATAGGLVGLAIDKDNRARGAAIGFGAGLALGYGLSQVNWTGVSTPKVQYKDVPIKMNKYGHLQTEITGLNPNYKHFIEGVTKAYLRVTIRDLSGNVVEGGDHISPRNGNSLTGLLDSPETFGAELPIGSTGALINSDWPKIWDESRKEYVDTGAMGYIAGKGHIRPSQNGISDFIQIRVKTIHNRVKFFKERKK